MSATQFYFRTPFATSGTKNPIPNDVQPSGAVSFTEGFGLDYELEIGVDPAALPVPRPESNNLYFLITQAIQQYQQFGTPEWIASTDNGGTPYAYAQFARVKYTDGNVWVSLVAANTATPGTDPTKWALAATTQVTAGNYAGIVVVNATPYTLLAANKGCLHIFTGSAAVVNMPAIAGASVADNFPMVNMLSTNITVNRDGTSSFSGVVGSTVAFTVLPGTTAGVAKQDTTTWAVTDLANNLIAQSWTNVTGSRALGTTYTNNTGRPIQLAVSVAYAGGGGNFLSISINGGPSFPFAVNSNPTSGASVAGTITIPNGATYDVTASLGALSTWYELR